jgi:hypothetical protein
MSEENVFNGFGVRVKLKNPDDFLKVKETLTRLGVGVFRNKTLYQSCHILHKRGGYAILHFKELFSLDGKKSDISEDDIQRRNTIVKLLRDWGLVEVIEPNFDDFVVFSELKNNLRVVKFNEKNDWKLISKYNIGGKHGNKTTNN